MEQPSSSGRPRWWVVWLAAAVAFALGLGISLVAAREPSGRGAGSPSVVPSRPPETGSEDRCARAEPGSEEEERCLEAGLRPDFGRPIPVTSLPPEFTAPCPGRFDKGHDAEWVTDVDALPASGHPRHEVKTEWVEFPSLDGLVIPGYLAQPVGGGPYPGVVWAHGGFFDDVDTQTVETIASAGFVVLGVAYRGSSGHGSELEWAVDIAGKEVDDLAAGAHYLQDRRVVEGPVAVAGSSHGGSLALSAAYRYPQLFEVVADFYGVTDWACILKLLQPPGLPTAVVEYSFGGPPDQVPDEYKERSALYNAGDIRMPVYIAHGLLDVGIPPGESLKLVKKLRANGTAVTARFYLGEGHGFLQREPADSPIWADFLNFLSAHLKET